VLFFAAFAAAYMVRSQAVVVGAAAVTAPLLLGLFRRGAFRSTVWGFRWLYGIVIGGGLLLVAAETARGVPLSSLLGAYSVIVSGGNYDLANAFHYIVYHAAELDLYLGVIPVAAAIVLTARARALDPALQVVLAATIAVSVWTLVVVGTFASHFALRIQERNTFALAPLFLILLLAWVERGAIRPRFVAPLAATAAALLVLAIPLDRFVTTSAVSDTLMLLPLWAIELHWRISWLGWLVFLGACAFALAFLLLPRRVALVLPLIVLAYWLVASKPIWYGPYPYGVRQAGIGAVFQGIRGVRRDWIDRAVPAGSDVAVLWTGKSDRFTVNQNEFFNRSVGQVYYTDAPTPGGAGEIPVRVDRKTGAVLTADGRPLRVEYLLADGSVEPVAHPVVRDPLLGMTVWRVNGPLVLAQTRVTGIYPDDTWSGPRVTWMRGHCPGGSLTISVSGDVHLFPHGNNVTASTGQRAHIPPNVVTTLKVPVVAKGGVCRARFDIAPTAVPSEVIPGNHDDRVLGTHFNAFAFSP
jgi:hypothetical protein